MSSDEKLCLKRVLLQGNEQQPVSACKVKVIVSELRSVRLAAQDPPHFIDCNLRGGDFRAATTSRCTSAAPHSTA